MDGKTLKDYILESVDHIIKRKSRPDCERICHVVTKKTKLDPKAVKEELERLVNSNILYKIIHKGIVSYRNYSSPRNLNAAKKTGLPPPGEGSRDIQMNGHEGGSSETPKTLQVIPDNESSEESKPSPPPKQESAINSATKPRPVGRPRKYPKVLEGSFPPRKRGRPPNSVSRTSSIFSPKEKYQKCDVCHFFLNKKGLYEELLICTECKTKAHPACLGYSPELAIKCQRFDWQCVDCKNCFLCNDPNNDETMLFCDSCDRGFHMSCHIPKVTTKPSGSWVCHCCILEDNNSISPSRIASVHKMAFETASALPSPNSLPSDKSLTDFERILKLYPSVVPKADSWTVEDVVRFFQLVGFPEQARAFREQEIDGKSLLLLKRSDVLTGMDLRLGPALKIYNHIKRLQSGLPNGHLL